MVHVDFIHYDDGIHVLFGWSLTLTLFLYCYLFLSLLIHFYFIYIYIIFFFCLKNLSLFHSTYSLLALGTHPNGVCGPVQKIRVVPLHGDDGMTKEPIHYDSKNARHGRRVSVFK